MTSSTPELLLQYAQKKYQLSKDERSKLVLLLDEYPDAFPDWEAMVGLTPPQIAHQVAEEFCARFPEPVLVPFPDGISRLHGFTSESFVAAIGPHRSWRQLEDALRNASRIFYVGERYYFCERKVSVAYATLRRKDVYGVRGDSREPETLVKKRNAKKREADIEINGKKQKLEFPRFDAVQCRHCWRYVFIDPKRITRKAPLCAQHDYPSSNSAYRARERLVPAYQKTRQELQRQIAMEYGQQKEADRGPEFLRNLATSKDSLFQALSSYMHSLNVSLNSDEDLLRAFNFIGDRKLPPEHGKQLDEMISFCLGFKNGMPVPLTILDCINAEAWLRAGGNCKYE